MWRSSPKHLNMNSPSRMRAIHILPAISEEASGPSYSVVRLCQALREIGQDVVLASMRMPPDRSAQRAVPSFVNLFPIGVGPVRAGRSPKMKQWLQDRVITGSVDILHNHGMWQMTAVYPSVAAKRGPAKLIVSPRGALSQWAMDHGSRWKKPFWIALQRPAFQAATCFHATAVAEVSDVRRMGFRQPVAVIPNGVDVPPFVSRTLSKSRTLLFLGRVHPKKGVDLLLKAWQQLMDSHRDWNLSIIGSDSGYGVGSNYLSEMRRLAETLRLQRVEFGDPAYGDEKWAKYREASLFVLPTHSENFGMTVAEALAAGTPVVVTDGAPWEGLRDRQAGWWISKGLDPLVATLGEAMGQPERELQRLGQNGRNWMLDAFSWETVGARMDATYRWVMSGGTAPDWVVTG